MDYIDRMDIELEELDKKIADLDKFIKENATYQELDFISKQLMNLQLTSMSAYAGVLYTRIRLAKSLKGI